MSATHNPNPKGLPKVTVFKRVVSPLTRKEYTDTLHTGLLVQDLGSHIRVWNPDSKANDGNDPSTAGIYPIASPRVWCVIEQPKKKESFNVA